MDFYEKAYKEMVQRARELHESGNELTKKQMEIVCPQLAESEDERIRRELLALVRMKVLPEATCLVRGGSVTRAQAEAYLEKQKENLKTVDSIPSFCISDVKSADTIITRVIVSLSDDVDYNRDEPCKYRREIDDLKKLRDVLCGQKEQKPAEWSEEDEAAFDDLMWCIEQARKSAKDENDMGNIWFAENWIKNRIKSLRPQHHWKPSMEQIEAVRESLNPDDPYYSDLSSLYVDLQKLL